MTEYGRIHTDGSRSGGQPVQSDVERVARALAQADGIEICSDATYALSSYGHKAQAALAAMRQPTQSNVAAAGTDRIGGGGGLPCGVVGVATQSDAVAEGVLATQKAHTMVREVLAEWGIEPRSTTPAQLTIATTEALCRAVDQIEDLRAQAQAQYDRGYYDGCANPIVRHDALRDALADLLHAVCGKTGFAETVRRDSGRIYPWPALDLAETKAIAALEQSK